MRKDSNYKFQISISQNYYETKAQAKAAITGNSGNQSGSNKKDRISYLPVNITPCQLLDKVLNGYTFCALFSNFKPNCKGHVYVNTDGSFTSAGKAGEFFRGSFFIGVDIDETKYETSSELIRMLSLKPTLWYTSFSHMQIDETTGTSKGVRLRLIYVFDKLIEDKYFFRYCSSCLHQIIEKDLDEEITDKCGLSCSQYFIGTFKNNSNITVECGLTEYIYSLSDVNISDIEYYNFLLSGCHYKVLEKKQKEEIFKRIESFCSNLSHSDSPLPPSPPPQLISEWDKSERLQIHDNECEFDEDLIDDCWKLPWNTFYEKYKHKYPYVYRVEKSEWSEIDGVLFQWCDDNYFELNWLAINQKGTIERITDGHHRRSTLFHRGWMRRIIMPEITPSILLFNLMVDRERFFDNKDGVLNLTTLVEKVKQCFCYSVEELKQQYSEVYESTKAVCSRKRFILHRNNKDVNAKSLAKKIRWRLLDEIYDKTRTFMDNLQLLNDSDFPISRSALYRYCSNRGIVNQTSSQRNYGLFKELHLEGMNLRDEQKYLQEKGLKIALGTLAEYRKRFQQEPKIS